jgi:hypothetical protein
MDPKKKAILERIKSHEDALTRAHEYLETGAHADWHGFRALFTPKIKDGREAPPHRDWVRNVFIPNCEKAMHKAERKLDQFDSSRLAVGHSRGRQQLFLFTIVAKPETGTPDAEDAGGAYVNAWINSTQQDEAEQVAKALIRESGWSPGLSTDVREFSDISEICEEDSVYFQEAASSGYCLVFHQWPKGADDSRTDYEIN